MPLKSYGVLKGQVVEVRLALSNNPHYQVRLIDEKFDYRIAINVKSALAPSEVEYIVVEKFQHPILNKISNLPLGYTELKPSPDSGALDYIRGNLFNRSDMKPLPFEVPGIDNDLNEKIDRLMQRAMADKDAIVYAFGEHWGPEDKKDRYFGFLPGNGIHDIHMNQGNVGKFVSDDGVWQDGGLLINFPKYNSWVALFLKFQSQAWHTDDVTGHRISNIDADLLLNENTFLTTQLEHPADLPITSEPQGLVRIVAAIVNGSDSPETEIITLINTAPHTVDMSNWAIIDSRQNQQRIDCKIEPGQATVIQIHKPVTLSNKGDTITLVDDSGLKVDGVSYTQNQAKNPGWTIVF